MPDGKRGWCVIAPTSFAVLSLVLVLVVLLIAVLIVVLVLLIAVLVVVLILIHENDLLMLFGYHRASMTDPLRLILGFKCQ